MAIEHLQSLGDVPVCLSNPVAGTERESLGSAELGEGRIYLNNILSQLARVLTIHEEKDLILPDRTGKTSTLLSATRYRLFFQVKAPRAEFLVAPEVEATTVKLVSTRACVDVDSARSSQ